MQLLGSDARACGSARTAQRAQWGASGAHLRIKHGLQLRDLALDKLQRGLFVAERRLVLLDLGSPVQLSSF